MNAILYANLAFLSPPPSSPSLSATSPMAFAHPRVTLTATVTLLWILLTIGIHPAEEETSTCRATADDRPTFI